MFAWLFGTSRNYTQGANATLRVVARANNSWGRLNAAGTATLAGTLALDLVGGYAPAMNFTTTILSGAGGRNGTFATTPAGWTTAYGANDVTMTKQ